LEKLKEEATERDEDIAQLRFLVSARTKRLKDAEDRVGRQIREMEKLKSDLACLSFPPVDISDLPERPGRVETAAGAFMKAAKFGVDLAANVEENPFQCPFSPGTREWAQWNAKYKGMCVKHVTGLPIRFMSGRFQVWVSNRWHDAGPLDSINRRNLATGWFIVPNPDPAS
jgi:hypothetical protein